MSSNKRKIGARPPSKKRGRASKGHNVIKASIHRPAWVQSITKYGNKHLMEKSGLFAFHHYWGNFEGKHGRIIENYYN